MHAPASVFALGVIKHFGETLEPSNIVTRRAVETTERAHPEAARDAMGWEKEPKADAEAPRERRQALPLVGSDGASVRRTDILRRRGAD